MPLAATPSTPPSDSWNPLPLGAVPELEIDLPATAIGKDYLGSSIFGTARAIHAVNVLELGPGQALYSVA